MLTDDLRNWSPWSYISKPLQDLDSLARLIFTVLHYHGGSRGGGNNSASSPPPFSQNKK